MPEQRASHLDQRQHASRPSVVPHHQIAASMAEGALQDISPFEPVIDRGAWRALYVGLPLCLVTRRRRFHDFEVLHVAIRIDRIFGSRIRSGPSSARSTPCAPAFEATELTLAPVARA